MKVLRNISMTLILTLLLVMLAVPAKAAGTEDYIDYSGETINFIKADGSAFGMFAAQDGTTCMVVDDEVVIHYCLTEKSAEIYDGIHWGLITDEDLTKDVDIGVDRAMDIRLSKSNCGKGIPIAPVKPDGTTAKAQYYLAIPAESKLPSSQTLTITGTPGMFKLISASLEKNGEESNVIFALSGKSYHNLFKGDYDMAVANGDNRDNWIKGYENAEGKWEFKIKIENGETYIPLVSISETYLAKYENKENPLARAFYPRQITIDPEAKTILAEDYKKTEALALTNYEAGIKVKNASLTTIGGPNSNEYQILLNLKMTNDDYNAAFIGSKTEAAKTGAEIFKIAEDNTIAVTVEKIVTPGDTASIISILEQPSAFSFRSKKDGSWMESKITVSKKNKRVVLGTKKEIKTGTQVTVGGLVYKTTSKTAAALVKPGKKTLTKVTIPATVKIQGQSFKVTAIQAKAFKKNTKLKTLTIGGNVKSIGASAFEGCTKITKITIPAAVTTIGNKAFYNCKKATKLVIKGIAIKTFGKKSFAKTGIKKLSAPKKKKAAYKKKLIKAGLKKTVK